LAREILFISSGNSVSLASIDGSQGRGIRWISLDPLGLSFLGFSKSAVLGLNPAARTILNSKI
jgi:hypothetical protein